MGYQINDQLHELYIVTIPIQLFYSRDFVDDLNMQFLVVYDMIGLLCDVIDSLKFKRL